MFKPSYSYFNENVKKNKVETDPQSFEDLFGEDYSLEMRNHFKEKEYPSDELCQAFDRDDPEWRSVCNASTYAVIRLCGRKAQHNSENQKFLLDDVFRMYSYSVKYKYKYNPDAHLWVFYIGTLIPGDKEKYIWIQSPNSDRGHRYKLERLNPKLGMILTPYRRDMSAYGQYIKPFESELEQLTTKFKGLFEKAFEKADEKLNDAAGGRRDDIPAYSDSVWPFDPFMYI